MGAPSPFDRQNINASASAANSSTGASDAALALNTRAPSMYSGTPAS